MRRGVYVRELYHSIISINRLNAKITDKYTRTPIIILLEDYDLKNDFGSAVR